MHQLSPAMVEEAASRIKPYARETELRLSASLGALYGSSVFLKLENRQESGSFKLRGAANRLLSLSEKEKESGVISASTGNHALACAYMAAKLNIPLLVYVPEEIDPARRSLLRQQGVDIRECGRDCAITEAEARNEAAATGRVFLSPYNDPLVIAGQGTVGREMAWQQPQIDTVLVPVGGGGLISGVALYLKSRNPKLEIIGCQPEKSAVMAESFWAGRQLDLPSGPTLSEGTAGGLESDTITFDLCRQLVDDFILVPEEKIARAIVFLIEKEGLLAEGAAALPLAALMTAPKRFFRRKIALILSGCRLSASVLGRALALAEGDGIPEK